jgi:hypothetical protein
MSNRVFSIAKGWVELRLNHLVRSTQPTPQSVIIDSETKNFVSQPKFLISQLNRKSFSILIQNLSFILYQFGQVYSKTVHDSIQTLMREFQSASHQKSKKE